MENQIEQGGIFLSPLEKCRTLVGPELGAQRFWELNYIIEGPVSHAEGVLYHVILSK
jgi:hypothetical protein